jgi:hypothetical protein
MVDRFTMKVISYNDQSNTVNTYSPNGLLTEWLSTTDLATRTALPVQPPASNAIQRRRTQVSKLFVIIVTRRLGFEVPELVP